MSFLRNKRRGLLFSMLVILLVSVMLYCVYLYSQWNDVRALALSGNADRLEKVLESNPKLANEHSFNKRPPIYFAKTPETLSVLLKYGANPNGFEDYLDYPPPATPLHLARDVRFAELLVEAGADIDAAGRASATPLFAVSSEKWHQNIWVGIYDIFPVRTIEERRAIAEYLIEQGADVNAIYISDDSHIIDFVSDPVIYELLKDAGAVHGELYRRLPDPEY